jgi:hypothetical protein
MSWDCTAYLVNSGLFEYVGREEVEKGQQLCFSQNLLTNPYYPPLFYRPYQLENGIKKGAEFNRPLLKLAGCVG